MKPILVSALAVLTVRICSGGPAETVTLAAMKLSDQPNYSWLSTVTDDARTYDITGKTRRGGYTWVRLPMVQSLARRLGPEAETDIEAVFKGNSDCVIRTGRGWKALAELPRQHRDWIDAEDMCVISVPTGYIPIGGVSKDPFDLDPFDSLRIPQPIPAPVPIRAERPYSNAQFGISRPHEELGIIVSSCNSLKVEGDFATGTLADIGAQLLLVRDGQKHIKPVTAAGAFELWMKGGVVMKYFVKLEGILLVNRKKIFVQQTCHTELKDVGLTILDVPEEAKWKLER